MTARVVNDDGDRATMNGTGESTGNAAVGESGGYGRRVRDAHATAASGSGETTLGKTKHGKSKTKHGKTRTAENAANRATTTSTTTRASPPIQTTRLDPAAPAFIPSTFLPSTVASVASTHAVIDESRAMNTTGSVINDASMPPPSKSALRKAKQKARQEKQKQMATSAASTMSGGTTPVGIAESTATSQSQQQPSRNQRRKMKEMQKQAEAVALNASSSSITSASASARGTSKKSNAPAPVSTSKVSLPRPYATDSSTTGNAQNSQKRQQSTALTTSTSSTPQTNAPRPPRPRPPGVSHSRTSATPTESDDLRTALTRSLARETHECMICSDRIRRSHSTWSCTQCYSVIHLGCVATWARTSIAARAAEGGAVMTGWRCPGCQFVRVGVPEGSWCWCGKEEEPVDDRMVGAHSCGNTCSRALNGVRAGAATSASTSALDLGSGTSAATADAYVCPHRCTLPCHPGPCDPCTALAPIDARRCYCGRRTFTLHCRDLVSSATSSTVRSCGVACGKMLKCGRHRCARECHPGACVPCEKEVVLHCFCGKESKHAACVDVPQTTSATAATHGAMTATGATTAEFPTLDENLLSYSCGNVCDETLACTHHHCRRPCHPPSLNKAYHSQCPCDPALNLTCGCTRRLMSDLCQERNTPTRTKCTDPIHTCDARACGKMIALVCGHTRTCRRPCHFGPCKEGETGQQQVMKCEEMVEMMCGCGGAVVRVPCEERVKRLDDGRVEVVAPSCSKMCNELRSCGRHRCNARCCPATLAAHTCPLTCARPLKCGQHTCTRPCHRGPCPPCLEATFDEWRCNCGQTVVRPPIKCGVKMPQCTHVCVRRRACGHENLMLYSGYSHLCHEDTKPCPPCVVRTEKQCQCGRKRITVPCNITPTCTEVCDKVLPCGNEAHRCRRGCHAGPCLSEGEPCTLECKRKRRACVHGCATPCHGTTTCPETPCANMVKCSCLCGNRFSSAVCGATITEDHDGSAVRVRSIADSPLSCDEACATADRNRRLAHALGIKPTMSSSSPADTATATGSTCPFSIDLLRYAHTNLKWARAIEQDIMAFAIDPDRKSLRFPPMRASHRQFIESLVKENYVGLGSEQVDREPYRSVVVLKRGTAVLPRVTVTEFVKSRGVNVERMDVGGVAIAIGTGTTAPLTKLSACALHHVHILASVPRALRELLEANAPAKPPLRLPAINAVYIGDLAEDASDAADATDTLTRRLQLLLTDLALAAADELEHSAEYACECECRGCVTFGAQTKTTPYLWSIALRPNVAPSETAPLRLNEAERAAAVELLRQQEVRVEWVGDDEVVVMLKGASASTSMLHKAGEKLDGQASSSTLSFASATSLSRRKAEAMNMLPPELSNWLLWSLCGLYVDHEVQQHADAQMAKRLQQFEEDRPTASPDWADDLEDNHDENNGEDASAITRPHICCYGAVYSATEDYVHLLVVDEEFVVTGGKPKYHQPPGADAAAIAAPQPPQVPTRNAFDALEGMDVPTAVVADAADNEADTVPDSWDEIEDAGDEL